jgi:hypothetical protein
VGEYNSIAIDAQYAVHISYFDSTNGNLKYTRCDVDCGDTSNWHTITLDSTGDVGEYNSIVIDSQNMVHISYFDNSNQDLKYAKECYAMDSDCDNRLDSEDNCPNDYNGLEKLDRYIRWIC